MIRRRVRRSGFTLAELLIALAILGVIATFSIPKILSSTSSNQATAVAKEVAAMVSEAYSNYRLNSGLTTNMTARDLTSYMNYVSVSTASTSFTNNRETTTAALNLYACNTANVECLQLHNGAIVQYITNNSFGGTANYILYNVDPDGTGAANAGATIALYYNGRITTGALNTTGSTTTGITEVATDPSWLTWN